MQHKFLVFWFLVTNIVDAMQIDQAFIEQDESNANFGQSSKPSFERMQLFKRPAVSGRLVEEPLKD